MPTEFTLSQTDGRPMYLQIMEQIRMRVAVGDWEPGYRLPSIRELAVACRVSVITVKRAYQELETESVINTQPGRGSFVSNATGLGRKLREQDMEQHLRQAAVIAHSLGLSQEELIEELRKLLISTDAADKESES